MVGVPYLGAVEEFSWKAWCGVSANYTSYALGIDFDIVAETSQQLEDTSEKK